MAQKSPGEGSHRPGAGGRSTPAGFATWCWSGHSGAGKTTLVEALLAATGTIGRAGTVADGTTVTDHDPAAVRQQRSVRCPAPRSCTTASRSTCSTPPATPTSSASCAPACAPPTPRCSWSRPSTAWTPPPPRCGRSAPPSACPARSRSPGWTTRAPTSTRPSRSASDVFGDNVLPLYLPMLGDDGAAGRRPDRADHPAGLRLLRRATRRRSASPTREHLPAIEEARNELIEGIIAESEDETLMDRYLGGEEIETSTCSSTTWRRRSPAAPSTRCARSARETGVGLDALLEVLTSGFPSPLEHDAAAGHRRRRLARATPLTLRPGRPAGRRGGQDHHRPVRRAGLAGPGLLRHAAPGPAGARLRARHGRARPPRPRRRRAGRAPATPRSARTLREVPLLRRRRHLRDHQVGHAPRPATRSPAKDDPLLMAPWEMPEPLLPIAIVAKTRSDEDALAKNLGRLVAGDPTLRLERNAETHQLVLWCMGEAHADVVLDRLRAGGVELDTEPVRVRAAGDVRRARPRATAGTSSSPAATASTRSATSRSSRCPAAPASSSSTRWSAARCRTTTSRRWRRASGPRWSAGWSPATRWSTCGSPWSTARRTASTPPTPRSRPPARWPCARPPSRARSTLLEPVDEVTIRVPDAFVGAVMSDLSGRRGRVLGTEPDPDGHERTLVRAEVPATELVRYAVELRAMTSGAGTFTPHVRPLRPDARPPGRRGQEGARRVPLTPPLRGSAGVGSPGHSQTRWRAARSRRPLMPAGYRRSPG